MSSGHHRGLAPFVSLLVLVAGCEGRPPPPGHPDAGPVEPGEVRWRSCHDSSSPSCAEVELPLDWAQPEGETISIVVERTVGRVGGRQLWVLEGGPGGDVDGWRPFADGIARVDPRYDVYLMHQRGTGRSMRLSCPVEEAPASPGGGDILDEEWPACVASLRATYGSRLAHINVTNAARDLGYLIDHTREPDDQTLVMGTSYGTLLAQRYLQIYPGQSAGVAILGIVPPDDTYTRATEGFDAVGRRYLELCGADPLCSGWLGPDPLATLQDVVDRVGAGHCPRSDGTPWDPADWTNAFGFLLYSWYDRVLVPALVHRLDRCSVADQAALEHFAGSILGTSGVPTTFSWVFFEHVILSEFWSAPIPTLDEARAAADGALFGSGGIPELLVLRESWPLYEPDAFDGVFAETDVPMLLLNGALDPATPIDGATRVGAHFAGARQTFLALPYAGHGFDSPTAEGDDCALVALLSFLDDPEQPIDDCGASILAPDFLGSPALAATAFAAPDLWEDTAPGASTWVAPADPVVLQRLRSVVRGRTPPPRPPGDR